MMEIMENITPSTVSESRRVDRFEKHMQWRIDGRLLVVAYLIVGLALAAATAFAPSALVGWTFGSLAAVFFVLAALTVHTLRSKRMPNNPTAGTNTDRRS